MITNSTVTVKPMNPIRYIIQSGVVCWASGIVCWVGGGDDGDEGSGDDGSGFGFGSGSGSGCDSVVKALAALQSLQVSELVALTFQ